MLTRAPEAAAIYVRLVQARMRADWQYRASTIIFTIGQVLAALLDFAAILVVFAQVRALAGWSLYDVLFLYATSGIAFALGDLFVSPVERASFHIKQGSFDQFLLRPVGPLMQLTTEEFALRRVGKLVQPLAALALALPHLGVGWSPGRLIVLTSTLVSGTVILSSLWVITSSISFWTVETQEVANAFTYGGGYATQYPLDVLSPWLRRLLLVIPLAFVNYLPISWLLGRPDAFDLPGWTRFSSPAVAVAIGGVATFVWRVAIRHYRSTGS